MTSIFPSVILDAMKICVRSLILIITLFVLPSLAYSFDGPLQVKNQYPIFLHAGQPYLEKARMENSFSASLSHSGTYTVQSSGSWLIALDMEITEVNLRYKRIIRDVVEFGLDVPVLWFSDGFMDGFLINYHDTFGFRGYGRDARPRNEFLYEIRQNDVLIIKGETGIGLGDIRLTLKKPLVSENGFNLALKGDLELPTGNAEKGYGNGRVDAGISVLLDKNIGEFIMTYWNFGAVFPGDVSGYQKIDLKNFVYGGAAIEVDAGRNFSVLTQIQVQSSIYPETDLKAVDRPGYLLAFGGRYDTGDDVFELSLTEDVNESAAPDFIINLSYKRRL
ncbi:hypothetical protein BMS3Bbin08_01597 [bacterium BMS3Bbin08]|nr:hypothetical protein BMS3Bbin08_01597 [bacterium BMS3Bbin08]